MLEIITPKTKLKVKIDGEIFEAQDTLANRQKLQQLDAYTNLLYAGDLTTDMLDEYHTVLHGAGEATFGQSGWGKVIVVNKEMDNLLVLHHCLMAVKGSFLDESMRMYKSTSSVYNQGMPDMKAMIENMSDKITQVIIGRMEAQAIIGRMEAQPPPPQAIIGRMEAQPPQVDNVTEE